MENTIQEVQIYKNLKSEMMGLKQDIINLEVSTKENIGEFCNKIDSKLESFTPSIMLYGCYNSGKSTIMNALFGKKVAEVGDKPQTSQIQQYTYHNYTIYDTPGINAPMEHEKVTSEHYKKCEVILFVISNASGVDEKITYDKIKQIVDDKKPVIMVLNKKQDASDEELKAQEDAIYANLEKYNIDKNKCSLKTINAQSAFKGRVEGKNSLFEKSGFQKLDDEIKRIIDESGKREVINVVNKMFEETINTLFHNIDNKISNPQLKIIEEEISKYEMAKRNCKQELLRTIQNILGSISTIDESQINQMLENCAKKIEYSINDRLQGEAKHLQKSFEQLKLQYKQIEMDTNDATNATDIIDSKIVAILGTTLATLPIPIPVLKPIGAVLMTIAPLIDKIKDVFGNKAEREKERTRAMQDKFREAKNSLQKEAESSILQGVDSLFNPLISGLNNTLDNHKVDEDTLRNLKEKLSKILTKLPVLDK
ncbi:hypothetical protein CQA53_00005 [Helicobacter didelphidarum]|uniref:G domain-containing protein n=1 Tax=Helicobacter didelphidarum TaxID=2040648 RepID=A0A3D8IQI0_9HELI|nr:GTPase [Helicobacter didelphidarum]RDU67452.1 hypothetical protein CQA53_00005 [Helicobacter didelphidarum]